jgi:transposase-like protein
MLGRAEPWIEIMRYQAAAPASGLPSLMMPCPVCAGRMSFSARHPISAEFEDSVYTCSRCGAELIRTSMRKASKPEPNKTSEAA